ncbi:MAG TPA: hypothetical protein VNO30_38870 [Kofleriaceae bacterium]|nr:hypothetical protein [Kofleriaceae bacterium]
MTKDRSPGSRNVSPSALRYIVLFSSKQTGAPVPPLVPLAQIALAGSLYGLDPEVVPVLPVLRYILNLPRNALDLQERSFKLVRDLQQLDLPHDVLFAPWPIVTKLPQAALQDATLVIHPDTVPAELVVEACPGALLGAVAQHELSVELCNSHWARLADHFGAKDSLRHPHRAELNSVAQLVLNHTARLFSIPGMEALDEPTETQFQLLRTHHDATALALLEEERVPPEKVGEEIDRARDATEHSFSLPVVIVAPGVAAPFQRAFEEGGATGIKSGDGNDAEREAMEILGAHRAIARGGASVVLPSLSTGIFQQLRNLEREYDNVQRRPKRVLELLSKIGRLLGAFLEEHLYSGMIAKSNGVLIMSQFPLGLATPRGSKSPLCSWKPLYYRPLIPLTRMLQMELSDRATCYWEESSLQVLVVECLDPEDPLFEISMESWSALKDELKDYEIEIARASSIAQVAAHLQRVQPDILILSGHGTSGPARNQRSIVVGNELYTGIEIPTLPPLVFLSVCSTAPRGAGDISAADMMLRYGAYAVVCCMVPVDVGHNARLFMRLLIYMHEAERGRMQLRSFADVWHNTILTHHVFDILHSVSRTKESKHLDLEALRSRFMTTPLEMRRTHAYQDALLRLEQIADEFGQKRALKRAIGDNGFLPESLFYMVIGWPEKIILNSPLHRASRQASRHAVSEHMESS